jgi:hypothetical protein
MTAHSIHYLSMISRYRPIFSAACSTRWKSEKKIPPDYNESAGRKKGGNQISAIRLTVPEKAGNGSY